MPRHISLRVWIAILIVQCGCVFSEDAPSDPGSKLVAALGPLLDVTTGKTEHYTIRSEFNVGGKAAQWN